MPAFRKEGRCPARHFPAFEPPGEDCIFNTAGGVGGQAHVPVRLEGGDALDEPDGADGDEIVLVARLGVVFFDDVGHQAEVVFDEGVPRLQIPGGVAVQVFSLFLRRQGLGKGAGAAGESKRKEESLKHQDEPGGEHGLGLLYQRSAPSYSERRCPDTKRKKSALAAARRPKKPGGNGPPSGAPKPSPGAERFDCARTVKRAPARRRDCNWIHKNLL